MKQLLIGDEATEKFQKSDVNLGFLDNLSFPFA